MKQHILVPYDFSPASALALEWAASLHRLAGGTLHVVHVVKASGAATMAMPGASGANASEIEQLRRELELVLRAKHVDGTCALLLSASPSAAILETSIERKSTLIVMGTHGRTGFQLLALGSVADFLVRNAQCPVVTMRAPEKE